jgi:hypothetical protein
MARSLEEQMTFPLQGGCDCGEVRYRMQSAPLFVHCCHCRWCQRETGASFALNALIESDRLALLGAKPELLDTPSQSGMGQTIARCRQCRIALWSHYAGAGPILSFVRVGTLDEPDHLPPPAVPEYYDREKYWPRASLERRRAFLPQLEAYQAELKRKRK